jgi:hypothetical protein
VPYTMPSKTTWRSVSIQVSFFVLFCSLGALIECFTGVRVGVLNEKLAVAEDLVRIIPLTIFIANLTTI